MDNEQLVKSWHEAIITECRKRLGRNMTMEEDAFITSRGGFIAIEMIEDTIKTLEATELEEYLNSEERTNKS